MANQGGLQLLPETRKKIEVKVPGENRMLSIGIVAVVLVFGIFLGLNVYRQNLEDRLGSIDAQVLAVERQRDKTAEENLLALSKQTKLMQKLLGDHIYVTKALDKLGTLLQNQVQITGITILPDSGKMSFIGHAANFTVVARQIASFDTDDGITDVNVGSIKAANNGGVDFSMDLLLNETKYFNKTNEQQ